jgi:hypothetical protein
LARLFLKLAGLLEKPAGLSRELAGLPRKLAGFLDSYKVELTQFGKPAVFLGDSAKFCNFTGFSSELVGLFLHFVLNSIERLIDIIVYLLKIA